MSHATTALSKPELKQLVLAVASRYRRSRPERLEYNMYLQAMERLLKEFNSDTQAMRPLLTQVSGMI